MSDYKITVGLEIHAELKTKSKMFCGCKNDPEEKSPNANICPICMGHPGTLPVINKEAIKKVLSVGVAVGSKLANFTEFDRKNYFYPDIPKGYQISQYKYPLVSGGSIDGVDLTRIHLEEDTARSIHDSGANSQFPISNFQSNLNESISNENSNIENSMKIAKLRTENSLVDYNRAGVPLMELVTEPVIHSSVDAMNFAREFQLLLQYLGVSDANMEKGEMRVEVNISVNKSQVPMSNDQLGTKVEVKNINSFRAAGKAIDFEFERQKSILEKGEKVIQETRGWDENKSVTFSQRAKESAHDYRYFPEPDLPKIFISEIPEFDYETIKKSIPELPQQKRERFSKDFGLKSSDIETYINNREACNFFETVSKQLIAQGSEIVQSASNYITSDIIGLSKVAGNEFSLGLIEVENFVSLIIMIKSGDLSSRGAKDVLKIMYVVGGSPEVIAKEKGLIQKNDSEELRAVMQEIITTNPESVAGYKAGKESLLHFFVGHGMKAMKGAGNPELIRKITLELLK
ncbi:MAG: Asp-tRNA(Asn)/Glu-tRNA(Gln) amidotransferase subunit GatB [Candidatus Zambryskibacteria bacterium]|nr:Asp-tRNA(Asn)/Glu-tRNA(Gln) amidotransferase subunit GatB [Candidatus Zambryskibacteria bacterium]